MKSNHKKKQVGKTMMEQALVLNTSLNQQQSQEAVGSLLELIRITLLNGGTVSIPNVGTLNMKVLQGGKAMHFGSVTEYPTRFKVKFTQSRNFRCETDPLDKVVESTEGSPLDALRKLSFIRDED